MHTTRSTTRSTKRSTKRSRAALLALPVLALTLGACTKTTYSASTNTVEVTMAGGVDCSNQADLTSCTNMKEVAWAVDRITIKDGRGRIMTKVSADLGLPCGFWTSLACYPTDVLTKKIVLDWQPCGNITTTVSYARLPKWGDDVALWVNETSTAWSGRSCPPPPSTFFANTPA